MVSNYVKSPEGIAEYKKIGLEYPSEFFDNQYDEYLNQTRKSPKDKTLVEIRNVTRVILLDGSQYIVHEIGRAHV